MSRMTVRLPTSLHQQLDRLAHEEGVSMNQYVVYALTRQAGMLYDLSSTTPAERQEERRRWEEMRKRLGPPLTADAVRAALARRDPVAPEAELSPAAGDLIRRLEGGAELAQDN